MSKKPYIYFTITETVFQCKNEKNDEFCEQAWICDSRFRWKCMKSCNICFEGDHDTPARTHSILKWTKISSLDINIFCFKNDSEKWSRIYFEIHRAP